jgi:hypothetical protein
MQNVLAESTIHVLAEIQLLHVDTHLNNEQLPWLSNQQLVHLRLKMGLLPINGAENLLRGNNMWHRSKDLLRPLHRYKRHHFLYSLLD